MSRIKYYYEEFSLSVLNLAKLKFCSRNEAKSENSSVNFATVNHDFAPTLSDDNRLREYSRRFCISSGDENMYVLFRLPRVCSLKREYEVRSSDLLTSITFVISFPCSSVRDSRRIDSLVILYSNQWRINDSFIT